MDEVFQLNPVKGISYKNSQDGKVGGKLGIFFQPPWDPETNSSPWKIHQLLMVFTRKHGDFHGLC